MSAETTIVWRRLALFGPPAALALGLAVFVVFLGAWDAIAGIATGILVRTARGLPLDQQDAAFGMSEALFRDPLVGGASIGVFSVVGGLGAMLGLVGAALALRHAGAPKLPCVLVGGAGLTFLSGHLPTAPVSLALLLTGTALLERRGSRVASHLAARDELQEDLSIVVPTIPAV